MALDCPNGHGRQNVVVNITPDASNPRKASDIVAKKLACGCVVGGEEYEKFREVTAKIDLDRSNAIRQINEKAHKEKAAAYSSFVVQRGGQEHAE